VGVAPQQVQPEAGRELELKCSSSCSEAQEGYLAKSCDYYSQVAALDAGHVQNFVPLPAHPSARGTRWQLTVDASPLEVGALYHLCVDTDGAGSGGSRVGDSGLTVYVTPVLTATMRMHVSDFTVETADGGERHVLVHEVHVACNPLSGDVCSLASAARLAEQCGGAVAGAAGMIDGSADDLDFQELTPGAAGAVWPQLLELGSPVLFNAGGWVLRIPVNETTNETGALEPGRHYQLCTDFDGPSEKGEVLLEGGAHLFTANLLMVLQSTPKNGS